MVQSLSWEANWFATSQEIPRISRNPKVHYRTHKPPPPVSILGQPNPVHIPTSNLLEIHPNIIHPSKPRSPQWSLSLRFPHQDPIHPFSSPIHPTCPAHLILLDFITRTILGEQYKSFSSSLCNLLHSPVTSSLLGPNILRQHIHSEYVTFIACMLQLWLHIRVSLSAYTQLPVLFRIVVTLRMAYHGSKHIAHLDTYNLMSVLANKNLVSYTANNAAGCHI